MIRKKGPDTFYAGWTDTHDFRNECRHLRVTQLVSYLLGYFINTTYLIVS
jgi:hypothetical protein